MHLGFVGLNGFHISTSSLNVCNLAPTNITPYNQGLGAYKTYS